MSIKKNLNIEVSGKYKKDKTNKHSNNFSLKNLYYLINILDIYFILKKCR